jgi:diguanylate cyclase (GGDEF)-like protein/PAS domain S-box-containing protein
MQIHPSHQPEARRALRTVALGVLVLLLVVVVPSQPFVRGLASYLPLHTGLEILSIAISLLIFGVVWSLRNESLPRNVSLLAYAFLGVGLLDFTHMLSYQGMPDFITPSSPEKAIFFWLCARAVGSGALLIAALPWAERTSRMPQWALLGSVLLLVVLLHLLWFIYPHVLPRTFIAGQGLTTFKIGMEYALITVNLLTAWLLWRRLRVGRDNHVSGMFAAACLTALSEFYFTLYGDVTDLYNVTGHIYKALAYLFLFRALFVEVAVRPYALLRESQQRLQATLNALPDLMLEVDGQGRYCAIHTTYTQDLVAPAEKLLGDTIHQHLPASAVETIMQALAQAREEGLSRGKLIELPRPDGRAEWFELSVARKDRLPGQEPHFIVISRNVTQRHQSEQALRQLSVAVEQSPISVVITDLRGCIEYVNAAFTRVSGYALDEVLGHNPRILQSGKTPASTYQSMWSQLTQGKPWQGEVVNKSKAGEEYIESVLIYPVRDPQGEVTHYLAHKENITEKKRASERLERLSGHDQLTGLPNRRLLQTYFAQASSHGAQAAVLWIDLDNFKDINDSLGHNTGDMLLLEVTRRLRDHLEPTDWLIRHAGDDFIALLPGASQDRAAALAQQLLHSLAEPLELAGEDLSMTASIGIALCPADAADFDPLLHKAETAMYRVKDEGRNHYCFFTPELQARSSRTLGLAQALKHAQQRGELHLVYQPQIALDGERIVGIEALLRWNSPQWGHVSPGEFIPIAESTGLIVPLGEWVLRTALAQLRVWRDMGLPPLLLAVNLSAVQFNQTDLPELIAQVLQEAGVPPQCLELELTEAVAMKNPEAAAARIAALESQGVQLSIDDFGTGYSSLSYLKRFRLHKLKIDQSFVRELDHDTEDQAIVMAIIQLARSLGLRTLAEGVETPEQLAFLRQHGCQLVQGYHFSKPLPPAQLLDFVRQRSSAAPASSSSTSA